MTTTTPSSKTDLLLLPTSISHPDLGQFKVAEKIYIRNAWRHRQLKKNERFIRVDLRECAGLKRSWAIGKIVPYPYDKPYMQIVANAFQWAIERQLERLRTK